ncbi:MAG: 30S ribosomal protein S6--L-glutamate ligase, partial [Desulfurococcales archaeon]|nr:30S ribosomal protein S6--L-glutamate ligase [Desulfurococcales archaeon]
GDEVLGGMYRYAPKNEWKTNVAQGASVQQAELTPELEELALRATEVLKLHYSGVDIGEVEGGYVIYEVNAMPNWQGFHAATGISPASKIADLVISLAKR